MREEEEKKKKRRKNRKRFIAVVLVVCTLINILYYSVQKSEAALPLLAGVGNVLYGFISSEAVWSTLMLAGVSAGIYTETYQSIDEINQMTVEEQEAYYYDYGINQQELMTMLVEGGYFDSPELAEVLAAAQESAAVDATLYQQMCEAIGVGGGVEVLTPRDPDDENTATTLALSSSALGTLGVHVRNAFLKWMEDKKEDMKEVAGAAGMISVVPFETLPVDYGQTVIMDGLSYLMSEYCLWKHADNYYCFLWTKNGLSDSQNAGLYVATSVKYNTCTSVRIVAGALGCIYTWSDDGWTMTNKIKGSTVYLGLLNGTSCCDHSNYLYSSVGFQCEDHLTTTEAVSFDGAKLSEEDAVKAVNAYMESLGLDTRYSLELAGTDVYTGNTATSIDSLDAETDKLIVIDNIGETVKDIVHPISTIVGTGTLTGVDEKVNEGAQTITDSVAQELTKEDASELSTVPYTPNLGPVDKYVVDGLEDVFPFCIPFDVARCIEVMVMDPEAPYIEFPFVFESWGIDEVIVLDMSKFEGVAAISRWIESIMFVYGLASKTNKFISW